MLLIIGLNQVSAVQFKSEQKSYDLNSGHTSHVSHQQQSFGNRFLTESLDLYTRLIFNTNKGSDLPQSFLLAGFNPAFVDFRC